MVFPFWGVAGVLFLHQELDDAFAITWTDAIFVAPGASILNSLGAYSRSNFFGKRIMQLDVSAIIEIAKWLLLIFFGAIGLLVLYVLGWYVLFPSIAPKKYDDHYLRIVLKDIKRHFGFLFDKGYEIRETHYYRQAFGDWSVELESKECVILIHTDRLELKVSFAPTEWDRKKQFGLGTMIYFISRGNKFIGFYKGNIFRDKEQQYERMANLLKEYLDQITPYFGSDFTKYELDLIAVQNTYNDLLIKSVAKNT